MARRDQTIRLTEAQQVLLAAAAQRDDRRFVLPA